MRRSVVVLESVRPATIVLIADRTTITGFEDWAAEIGVKIVPTLPPGVGDSLNSQAIVEVVSLNALIDRTGRCVAAAVPPRQRLDPRKSPARSARCNIATDRPARVR